LVAVVIGVAGVVVGLTPAYRGGRLLNRVPAWALAEMVPLFPPEQLLAPGPKVHPGYELRLRFAAINAPAGVQFQGGPRRELTNPEIAAVIRRMAEGNWYAPAGSERWVDTTGQWLMGQVFQFRQGGMGALQYPDGSPADEALVEAFAMLEGVMPRWRPRTRAAWPAGAPVRVRSGFETPRWVGPGFRPSEDATWSARGTEQKGTMRGFLEHFDLPALGAAGDEVVLELKLRLFRTNVWERPEGEEPLREEDFVLRWKVAADAGDVVELVDRPDIDAAMVAGFASGAWDFEHDLVLDPVWMTDPMEGIAFGVRVDIFDGDTQVGHIHHWWMVRRGETVSRSAGDAAWWDGITGFAAYKERVDRALQAGTLRLRISGVPEVGMAMLDAEKVWAGSVEVVLSGAMEAREAPVRQNPRD
jgi:hypothetical protein